jgi:pimeloyl-ACP methyl ester carboxylesterase
MTAAELDAALRRLAAEARPGACATPRYRLRYFSWGLPGGVPLAFIHGMNDLARSFAPLMARLVDAGVRCVGYELPSGHRDGANLGAYRHRHFVADLMCLLDHLGEPAADLFGSSFGSTVALRAAADHPARVRRVVLQGGFARRPLHWTERGLCRLGRYWFGLRMADLPFREREMRRREGAAFAGSDGAAWRFLLANTAVGPCRACALRSLMLDRLDLRPRLGRVRCPVLLIGGDRDGIVPRGCEAEVEAGVADVRRVELAGCGHYPQYTHVGEAAATVLRFLPLKAGREPA